MRNPRLVPGDLVKTRDGLVGSVVQRCGRNSVVLEDSGGFTWGVTLVDVVSIRRNTRWSPITFHEVTLGRPRRLPAHPFSSERPAPEDVVGWELWLAAKEAEE